MAKRTYTMTWQFLKARCRCDDDGDDGCWVWTQATNNNGHPVMTYQGRKNINAARFMWELFNGRKPKAILVRSCHNKLCMNPHHLLSRTRAQATRMQVEAGLAGSPAAKSAKYRAAPPRAKLTWPQVRELRAKLAEEVEGRIAEGKRRAALAAEAGISVSCLHHIRKGKYWREGILA